MHEHYFPPARCRFSIQAASRDESDHYQESGGSIDRGRQLSGPFRP